MQSQHGLKTLPTPIDGDASARSHPTESAAGRGLDDHRLARVQHRLIAPFQPLQRTVVAAHPILAARAGLPAVHYLYRSLGPEELVGAYLAGDVMMVTPLRDGMNLVAKEYVASRTDETGVLILSEFAGASEQLRQALIVNPHDVDHVATTLVEALNMDKREQQRRMRALRKTVTSTDVFDWAEDCLAMMGEE